MDLVAVCDINEEAARRCAKRFGAPRVVTDYHELLNPDEVDGVIVVVHAALHHKIAVDAMRAGLHVFTEKPPSITSAESLAVARVAAESGKMCMTAFKKRYAPAYAKARQIIMEEMPPGERHLEYTYNLSHYRMDDPDPAHWFLLDAGIHAIDAVRFFMGEVDELVTYKSGSNGRESYAIAMRFADGSAGTLNLSARGTPGKGHELLKVTGDGKTILVENVVNLAVYRRGGPTDMEWPAYVASGNWTEVTTGFAGELQAFERVLREGIVSISDIESSYRSMALYEAIRDSDGQPTRIRFEALAV
jgi:myo-inositol 2-dehydrogenase/D-chiro-inositol 1-dehydrogenase